MIGCKDVKSELLHILVQNSMHIVTSRHIQLSFPQMIEKEFGHQITPETVARVWREMRAPDGPDGAVPTRDIICSSEVKKCDRGRIYTEWTIRWVKIDDIWIEWNLYLKGERNAQLCFPL